MKRSSDTVRPGLWPTVLILVILLAGFGLRVTNFNEWPPGLSHDEAVNALDAYRLAHTGVLSLHDYNHRAEPLYRMLQAFTVGLVGPTRFGARLISLYLGVLGIAAAYRAGRHAVPVSSDARRWVGLITAGTLAVMVAHIHQSRVAYRGILQVLAMLLWADAFLQAWWTGHKRHFAMAGMWVAVTLMSYTASIVILPVLAVGLAVEGVRAIIRRKKEKTVYWRGVALLVAGFLVAFSPMLIRAVQQPNTYSRISELSERRPEAGDPVSEYTQRLGRVWGNLVRSGDINPQYNVNRTPLLHTSLLRILFYVGLAGCMLRPRRTTSWLALGLVFFGLWPNALAGELPHGLRIVSEHAALPLVMAASVTPVLWLAKQVKNPEWISAALAGGTGAIVALILVLAGGRSWHIYADHLRSDMRWGDEGVISAWTWFFETRYEEMADFIAERGADGVTVYLPLSAASHPSMRYFTLQSHPDVQTFTTAFGVEANEDLTLPPGVFLKPTSGEQYESTYVAYLPNGTIVLLPRLNADTLQQLEFTYAASNVILIDDHGETAAGVGGHPFSEEGTTIRQPVAHRTDLNFDNRLHMVGWDGPPALPEAGGQVEVTLYFTPGDGRRRDVDVLTQLWTLEQERVASSVERSLLRWLYPPDRWQAGDVVPYVQTVDAPPDLEWGAYQVAVGARHLRGRLLPVIGPDGAPVGEVLPVGMVKVGEPPVVPTANLEPLEAEVGQHLRLAGYVLATQDDQSVETMTVGEPLIVSLVWEISGVPQNNYTVFVHVHDGADQLVAQSDIQPEGGRYPTSVWSPGERVVTTHQLDVPADATGPFTLYAGMYTYPDFVRLEVRQDGEVRPDGRVVIGDRK